MAGEPHPPSPLGGVGDGGDGALGFDEGPGIGAGVKDLPQDSSVAGTEFPCSHPFDQEHIYEIKMREATYQTSSQKKRRI